MLIDAKTKLKGMEAVGRENVSEPHMFFGVPGAVCFVYSYDGATNLFQYAQPALLPQRIAFLQDVAKQMLLGVAYMHKVGLIHNDLKPENVMLSFPYPNNPTRPKATIIDFDLASPISYANGKIKPESDRSGTYPYHPPEVFRGIPADPTKKDTWSIGAIMYFLVTKKYLFPINNSSQFQQSVVNTMNAGFPSTQFQITPNAAVNTALKPVIDTIKALLVPNPEQRPSPSSYLASLRRVSIPTRRLSGPRTV
ncbi:kinase-like domain-containing protein [Syncephalis fuscata]|nr:kinase-like domain-containing protein [Syncephalis fuscata]